MPPPIARGPKSGTCFLAFRLSHLEFTRALGPPVCNQLVQAEAPDSAKAEARKDADIEEADLSVISLRLIEKREMVNQAPGYQDVDACQKRRQPRTQPNHDQERANGIRHHGNDQTGSGTYMDRIGKMGGHGGKVGRLSPPVLQEQASARQGAKEHEASILGRIWEFHSVYPSLNRILSFSKARCDR
jgi:hypothetical protein